MIPLWWSRMRREEWMKGLRKWWAWSESGKNGRTKLGSPNSFSTEKIGWFARWFSKVEIERDQRTDFFSSCGKLMFVQFGAFERFLLTPTPEFSRPIKLGKRSMPKNIPCSKLGGGEENRDGFIRRQNQPPKLKNQTLFLRERYLFR